MVGLSDINGTGTYSWSDGTSYDAQFEPGKCVYVEKLANDTVRLVAAGCEIPRAFVCAAPSEFCYGDNWYRYNGEWEQNRLCQISNVEQVDPISNKGIVSQDNIISKTQWVNQNGILSVELIFKIVSVAGGESKIAGITLHNFKDTICDYYFVAVKLVSGTYTGFELQFIKNINESMEVLDNMHLNTFGIQSFHKMDIMVYNGTYFKIKIDEKYLLNE